MCKLISDSVLLIMRGATKRSTLKLMILILSISLVSVSVSVSVLPVRVSVHTSQKSAHRQQTQQRHYVQGRVITRVALRPQRGRECLFST